MEREIKFMAWLKKKKIMLTVTRLDYMQDGIYINGADYKDTKYRYYYEALSPLEIELIQFTGLLDKNGKEIYEGDIIKIPTLQGGKSYNQKVIFNEGRFMLDFKYNKSGYMFTKNNMEQSEVIGNIYENKNLII